MSHLSDCECTADMVAMFLQSNKIEESTGVDPFLVTMWENVSVNSTFNFLMEINMGVIPVSYVGKCVSEFEVGNMGVKVRI